MADHRDGPPMAFERGLIHRAIGDSAFRAELVAHPTEVVQRELVRLKETLGDHQTVQVVEDTPTRVYIVFAPHGYARGGYAPYRVDKGLVQSQFGHVADHRDSRAMQFEHDLIHRAIDDGAFRAEFVAHPTAVVQRELV